MALDHALAVCLGPTEGVLRLYGWERPTVSFGRNEPVVGIYSAEAAAAAGLHMVRRPTGGRAVAHHRELTYSIAVPTRALGGPRDAFRAINEALAAALRSMGVAADLAGPDTEEGSRSGRPPDAPRHRMRGLSAGPCFRSPVPGEITALGRKLVGSAQARLGGSLLQHGSILVDDDQPVIESLTIGASGRSESGGRHDVREDRPAVLGELLDNVSIDELATAVAESLPTELGGRWAAGGYRAAELDAACRLESERYARDSWTWRR